MLILSTAIFAAGLIAACHAIRTSIHDLAERLPGMIANMGIL